MALICVNVAIDPPEHGSKAAAGPVPAMGRQRAGKAGCGMKLGDIVVGVFVALLGLTGLVLAAGALDQEIYVFGLSLVVFAGAFNWGLALKVIRTLEAARSGAGGNG
jgi:cytochrome b subunit of formate dehydrogenase